VNVVRRFREYPVNKIEDGRTPRLADECQRDNCQREHDALREERHDAAVVVPKVLGVIGGSRVPVNSTWRTMRVPMQPLVELRARGKNRKGENKDYPQKRRRPRGQWRVKISWSCHRAHKVAGLARPSTGDFLGGP
jgi:hypothetical protein